MKHFFFILAFYWLTFTALQSQSSEFAIHLGSLYSDQAVDFEVSSQNNVYLFGDMGPNGLIGANLELPFDTLPDIPAGLAYVVKFRDGSQYDWKVLLHKTTYLHNPGAITVDEQENIYIAGSFATEMYFEKKGEPDVQFLQADGRAYVAEYDSTGDLTYAFQFGGEGNLEVHDIKIIDEKYYVLLSAQDSIVLKDDSEIAHTFKSETGSIMLLAEMTDLGYFNWVREIWGSSFTGTIEIDSDTNLYVSANSYSDVTVEPEGANIHMSKSQETAFIAKYSKNGVFNWAEEPFGAKANFKLVQDVLYFVGEYFESITFNFATNDMFSLNTPGTDMDICFGTMDLSGKVLWANYMSSSGMDHGLSINADSARNVFVSGIYSGELAFGNSDRNDTTLAYIGGVETAIAKFNSDGEFIWARSLTGKGFDSRFDIAIDQENNILGWSSFGSDTAYISFTNNPADTLISQGGFDQAFIKIENTYNNPPKSNYLLPSTLFEDFGKDTIIIESIPVEGENDEIVTYTLHSEGSVLNYSFEGNNNIIIIESNTNLSGTHQFIITADDGQPENYMSVDTIYLDVLAVNDAPVLDEMTDPLQMKSNESLGLDIADFSVTDVDNIFPDDHSLVIYEGENYSVLGNSINPDADFTGSLDVSVAVSDGVDTSNTVNLTVEITGVEIDAISEPIHSHRISVYPNPAQDHIIVTIGRDEQAKVFIHSIAGEIVGKTSIIGKQALDISELNPGIYFIKVLLNEQSKTLKIVKE